MNKKILAIEDDNLIKFDKAVQKINNSNKLKKKQLKSKKVSFSDVFASNHCCIIKHGKYDILNKCQELIDELMDIGYIMNKLLEINFMKSMIFDERENMIFNYQKKRLINFTNLEKTDDYIESLNDFCDDYDFKLEEYNDIENREINKKEKLLELMSNYYL